MRNHIHLSLYKSYLKIKWKGISVMMSWLQEMESLLPQQPGKCIISYKKSKFPGLINSVAQQ